MCLKKFFDKFFDVTKVSTSKSKEVLLINECYTLEWLKSSFTFKKDITGNIKLNINVFNIILNCAKKLI